MDKQELTAKSEKGIAQICFITLVCGVFIGVGMGIEFGVGWGFIGFGGSISITILLAVSLVAWILV